MLFVIATYAGISAYNVSMSKRRLNKANKEITCKLSEVGYEMDKKTSKNICHNIVKSYDKEYYEDIKIGNFALSFFPILNLAVFVKNMGSDDLLHEYYECGIDNCLNKEVLNDLEEKDLITIRPSKKESKLYHRTMENHTTNVYQFNDYRNEKQKVKQKIKAR